MSSKKMIGSIVCFILSTSLYANGTYNQDLWKSSYSASDNDDYSNSSDKAKPYYEYKKKTVRHRSYKYSKETIVARPPQRCCGVIYTGAYAGYGVIDDAYKNDGQFVQGRLAIGGLYLSNNYMAGAELGVQSGNTMHLSNDENLVLATGGLQWSATLKPIVDLLISTKFRIVSNQSLYFNFKAGAAYRTLQLDDRTSANYSISRVNPEAQVGLSYNITTNTMLTILYQGIYSSSSVSASINDYGNGTISNIPTQQAGFIGVEYSL